MVQTTVEVWNCFRIRSPVIEMPARLANISRTEKGARASSASMHMKTRDSMRAGGGIGKTHLSTGLGIKACESGYKVLFTTLNDMVSTLMASMADNSFPAKLRQFIHPALLIIDEVGYLPVSKERANFLFQVVAKRYETGSIILTSNKSFADWGAVLGDSVIASAILDRLLHHSTVFNIRGDSYRLREKKKELMGGENKMSG